MNEKLMNARSPNNVSMEQYEVLGLLKNQVNNIKCSTRDLVHMAETRVPKSLFYNTQKNYNVERERERGPKKLYPLLP